MWNSNEPKSLAHLPVTLFSSVMGLAGVSLAWRRASHVFGGSLLPARAFIIVAAVIFVVLLGLYAAKWVRHPDAARAELRHPIRMTFLPTVTIASLLVATGLAIDLPQVARPLWWLGAVGHLALTVVVISMWFSRPDITAQTVTPAWLIPVVGNIVTPLAARDIGNPDLAWFSFGVGFLFWVALLPLLLQRVLTHSSGLPTKLLPTLAIFIAPPSVAMISWSVLTGETDGPLPRMLWAAAGMFVLLLASQISRLRQIPFALPYWAYTFPLAAFTVASLIVAASWGGVFYHSVAAVSLAVTTLLSVVVLWRTLVVAARGDLLRPE